jgi:hypothetical protein
VIESAEPMSGAQGSLPAVKVERGKVELSSMGDQTAVETLVRSPDRSEGFVTLPGATVNYSAFRGTSVASTRLSNRGD